MRAARAYFISLENEIVTLDSRNQSVDEIYFLLINNGIFVDDALDERLVRAQA